MTTSYEDDRSAAASVGHHVARLNEAIRNAWSMGLDVDLYITDLEAFGSRKRQLLSFEVRRLIADRPNPGDLPL